MNSMINKCYFKKEETQSTENKPSQNSAPQLANVELIKRIRTEKKGILPYLRNQNKKKINAETEKVKT